MGLHQLIHSCRRIAANPGVSTASGIVRHAAWHLVRRFAALPLKVSLTERTTLQLSNRSEMNGCVALAWSQRLYDFNNMSFILDITRRGLAAVCFDVGANLGAYSLLMSEEASARVIAFEPHPQTFRSLQNMLRANARTNVEAYNVALSSASGAVRFQDDDCNPMNRILSAADELPMIEVEARTGADVCDELQLDPDILKIDTEGHELDVLRGFGARLEKTKVLFIEENEDTAAVISCLPKDQFVGPIYLDYTRRCFSRSKQWQEDAIFLHRQAVSMLRTMGYNIDSPSA